MNSEQPNDVLAALDFPIQVDPESVLLSETYDELGQARNNFLQACEEYAEEPSSETHTALALHGNDLVTAFRKSVSVIQSALGSQCSIEAIFGLIVTEDQEHIIKFRDLAGNQDFDFVHKEWLKNELEKTTNEADSTEQLIELLTTKFGRILEGDLRDFTTNILQREKEKAARTKTVIIGRTAIADSNQDIPEDGERYVYYPFSIEPPLQIHRADFMGKNVEFNYSEEAATHGRFWIPESYAKETEPEEREQVIQEYIVDMFDQALNTFGDKSMQYIWQQNSLPESEDD